MPVVGVCRGSIVPAVVLEDKMMDTKEAIKELEDLTVDYGDRNEEQIARLDEAIDMAMEALRNLPNRLRQAIDTISRRAAIDALDKRFDSIPMEQTTEILLLRKDLRELPSAQPEERTEERTETHACDLISRQAAIDAVYKCADIFVGDMPIMVVKSDAYEALAQLPSAQPEQRWIPVDLRNNSPEENKVVLLGVRFQDDFKYFVTSRQDYNYWTGLGREINGELRWQPLPEQYRAERRTDERQT